MLRLFTPNKIKRWIYTTAVFLLTTFFAVSNSYADAVACSPPLGGNFTITSSCSFANNVDGVDNGNLTINNGATLTVNADQILVRNSGKSITIAAGGSIAINTTGQITETNLWVQDPDGDGLYNPSVNNGTVVAFSVAGGTITTSGGYTIHTFTSSGTFTVNQPGNVEVLMVGGGGGGGGIIGGGGGGGGVLYYSSDPVTTGAKAIVVGAGGGGGVGWDYTPQNGTNGASTTFNGHTALGGGGGSGHGNGVAGDAGSGGGNGSADPGGGTGTAGQGYNGGISPDTSNNGGGGGGAGAVGGTTNGGAGYSSSISGSTVLYAGGGGGGARFGSTAGNGTDGGGNGLNTDNAQASNGVANRGGGGGGGGYNAGTSAVRGGTGGSGIVIIRYPTPTSIVAGKYGNARSFNGASDNIDIGNSTVFDVTNYSIEAWVYSTNYTQNGFIFEKGPVNTQYSLFFEGGSVVQRSYNSAGTLFINQYTTLANAGISNSNWYHLVSVYDSSAIKLYVNGVLKSNVAVSGTLRTGQTGERIGAYGGTPAYYFNGNIDDVRVYNYARSVSQIAEDMNKTAPSGNGPVAWWKMDETSGSSVANYSYQLPSVTTPATGFIRRYTATAAALAATGGTITTSGGYTIHTFTSNGTFTANQAMNVEYLVVAGSGGGGGGRDGFYEGGGGGGAGGYRVNAAYAVTTGNKTVIVGGGGVGGTAGGWPANGGSGGDSVFDAIISTGGGGGGAIIGPGLTGGSGGGGGGAWAGGAGTSGQGYAGGSGIGGGTTGGGGGGGSSAVGQNGVQYGGGAGGAGTLNSISGSAVIYAVGGAGGGHCCSVAGAAGTTNRGNGGGGGSGGVDGGAGAGAAGGSGIVIIRYPTP